MQSYSKKDFKKNRAGLIQNPRAHQRKANPCSQDRAVARKA
jgi:hypothetical protein